MASPDDGSHVETSLVDVADADVAACGCWLPATQSFSPMVAVQKSLSQIPDGFVLKSVYEDSFLSCSSSLDSSDSFTASCEAAFSLGFEVKHFRQLGKMEGTTLRFTWRFARFTSIVLPVRSS